MTTSRDAAPATAGARRHLVSPRSFKVGRTALAFGIVGLGGMSIDLLIFNVLRAGVLGAAFSLESKPLTASAISAGFAIVFNWLGGRYWAFRDSRRTDTVLEFIEYAAVALLGLGIGLATLAFTHYTLGLTSLAADNISKNVIGLGLGTVTRFLLLRFWVWGRGSRGTSNPTALVPSTTSPISLPVRREAA